MGESHENVIERNPPVKIIAEVLAVTAAIWLSISIAGEKWVVVQFQYQGERTWNWGLLVICNTIDDESNVCIQTDWTAVCLVFSIVSLILSLAASLCGVLGIRVARTNKRKEVYFIVAASFMSVVAILELMVVIIFPVKFGENIRSYETVRRWDFDWTYGFAWGGLIFSVGAAVFFFLPHEYKREQVTTFYSTEYR